MAHAQMSLASRQSPFTDANQMLLLIRIFIGIQRMLQLCRRHLSLPSIAQRPPRVCELEFETMDVLDIAIQLLGTTLVWQVCATMCNRPISLKHRGRKVRFIV